MRREVFFNIGLDRELTQLAWLHTPQARPRKLRKKSALAITRRGAVIFRFNPFHDPKGRFANAPWGAAKQRALIKEYAEKLKGPLKALDRANKKGDDAKGDNARDKAGRAIQGLRTEFVAKLGLSDAQQDRMDRMLTSWEKQSRANGPLLNALTKGNSTELGAAAAWSQACLKAEGIASVIVYRGIQGRYARQIVASAQRANMVEIGARDASSWTTNYDVAKSFSTWSRGSGAILGRAVSPTSVLVYHKAFPTILGHREAEFVVAGDGFKMNSQFVHHVSPRGEVGIGPG